MKDKDAEYGVITEQGDLGLGFDVLTESEQEVIRKKDKEKDE